MVRFKSSEVVSIPFESPDGSTGLVWNLFLFEEDSNAKVVAPNATMAEVGNGFYRVDIPSSTTSAGRYYGYLTSTTGGFLVSIPVFEVGDYSQDELGAMMLDLDGDVVAVAAQLTDLDGDVAAVKAETALIKSDVTDILADVADLDSDVVAVAAQLTNLDSDVVAVAAQITDLDGDVATLQSTATAISVELGDMSAEASSVWGDVPTHFAAALTALRSAQKSRFSAVDAAISSSEFSIIAALNANHTAVMNNVDQAEAGIKAAITSAEGSIIDNQDSHANAAILLITSRFDAVDADHASVLAELGQFSAANTPTLDGAGASSAASALELIYAQALDTDSDVAAISTSVSSISTYIGDPADYTGESTLFEALESLRERIDTFDTSEETQAAVWGRDLSEATVDGTAGGYLKGAYDRADAAASAAVANGVGISDLNSDLTQAIGILSQIQTARDNSKLQSRIQDTISAPITGHNYFPVLLQVVNNNGMEDFKEMQVGEYAAIALKDATTGVDYSDRLYIQDLGGSWNQLQSATEDAFDGMKLMHRLSTGAYVAYIRIEAGDDFPSMQLDFKGVEDGTDIELSHLTSFEVDGARKFIRGRALS